MLLCSTLLLQTENPPTILEDWTHSDFLVKVTSFPGDYIVIGVLFFPTGPLTAQDLQWAYSDGSHLTQQALNVEIVPDGIVFLSEGESNLALEIPMYTGF